jgi:hypothetical protein
VSWPTRVAVWLLVVCLSVVGGALLIDAAEAQESSWASSVQDTVFTYQEQYGIVADVLGPGPLAHKMTRVAFCESRFDHAAYSAGYDRRLGVFYEHVGSFQISSSHWGRLTRELHGPDASLLDPIVNARMMAVILEQQGLAAWPVCGARA